MLLEIIFPGLAVHFLNCMVYFLFQKYASAIKILVFLMSYLNFNIYKLSLVKRWIISEHIMVENQIT